AAEIGVMPGRWAPAGGARGARGRRRAGRLADLDPQLGIAEQCGQQLLQRGVIALAGEMLEEAFELVAVAVGRRQEPARVADLGGIDARDRADLDLELLPEARHAALHLHDVPALEAPREHIGVAKGAREDRAGAVTQLDRQIWGAGTGDLALLARAGEYPRDLLVEAQRGHRLGVLGQRLRGGGHRRIMYGGSDAAPHLGPPS